MKAPEWVNEVRLVGTIHASPEQRQLPSGDHVWSFRLVVPRSGDTGNGPRVDAVDCAVWGRLLTRPIVYAITYWGQGDIVEVTGSLRRRFFRGSSGPVSRVEIDVDNGRLIRRASRRP